MVRINPYRSPALVSLVTVLLLLSVPLPTQAQEDLRQEVSQTWSDGEWVNDERELYEYSDEGEDRWITRTHQMWDDTTGVWLNAWKSVTIRNRHNLIADEKTYTWEDSSWTKFRDLNYEYNTKGRTTEWLRRTWNGSEWANDRRKLHEYDTLVTRTSTLEQTWNGSAWSDTRRVTYRYDDETQLTEKEVEVRENGAWENEERTLYTRDANGRTVETTVQVWENGSWTDHQRTQRSYEDGHLTEELRQEWNDGSWTDTWVVTYTYDADGNQIEQVREIHEGDSWTQTSRTQYVYEEATAAAGAADIPDRYALDPNYPNPFNPSTTITYAVPEPARVQLHVYNVLGKRVATLVDRRAAAGQHTVEWQAGDMPSGTYLYRLVAGDFTRTRTMVLVK